MALWTDTVKANAMVMRGRETEMRKRLGYSLILHNTDPLKGLHWLLEARIEEDDDEEIDLSRQETLSEVRAAAFILGQGDMRWFLQGESSHWIMIEFWTDDQAFVLNRATEIAAHVGWELELG